jgi:arylsulfatase A-like enzyme
MVKSTSSPVSPDLLVITIDTLRRDRLGCYGSDLGATTTFDSLAASGALFTDAFCQIPITLPAHTTIFTGVPPATHGIYENGSRRLAPSFPTLAGICSEHGYKTAAFVSAAPLEARYGLDKGFEIYNDDLRLPNREGWRTRIAYFSYKRILILKIYIEKFFSWSGPIAEIPGTETVDKAVKWLDSTDGAIFLWVHLYDPHIPYTPPESLREKFPAKEYEKRFVNEIDEPLAFVCEYDRNNPAMMIKQLLKFVVRVDEIRNICKKKK